MHVSKMLIAVSLLGAINNNEGGVQYVILTYWLEELLATPLKEPDMPGYWFMA
jgi:hypothetical protein